MVDVSFAGNAMRRRAGAASSHLGMMDDSDGVGEENANSNQTLVDMAQMSGGAPPATPPPAPSPVTGPTNSAFGPMRGGELPPGPTKINSPTIQTGPSRSVANGADGGDPW